MVMVATRVPTSKGAFGVVFAAPEAVVLAQRGVFLQDRMPVMYVTVDVARLAHIHKMPRQERRRKNVFSYGFSVFGKRSTDDRQPITDYFFCATNSATPFSSTVSR